MVGPLRLILKCLQHIQQIHRRTFRLILDRALQLLLTHLHPHRPPPEAGVTDSHTPVSKVKLPKLVLKKFNGDFTKWATFWDLFESSIHNNTSLSDINKFNYLNAQLEGCTSEAVAGLRLTSVNYSEAIAILKRRFSNMQLIITDTWTSFSTLMLFPRNITSRVYATCMTQLRPKYMA